MQRTHSPLLALTTLAALGLAAAQPAQAQTYTFTGSLDASGPVYNRPLAGTPPTALSGVGTAVHYSVFTFTVTQPGAYSFLSTATFDNFTFLYGGTFSPASPLTNVLIGNDDITLTTSGFTYTLNPSTTYQFVTSSFSNAVIGTFSNTITGPGTVVAPESSQVAAFGIGLMGIAGLALKAHKRRTAA